MSEHESKVHDELSERDAELANRIAQALDDSVEALDADSRARLVMIRHRALARTRHQRIAGAVALAASVLVLVATPWMLRQHTQDKAVEDVAYLSVDPEMLADMDMLLAIGEPQ
ncbi:MAG TPA: hypothetical protein VFM32_01495 [Spongiibacteraceae bacterium]|nr:hypothetical protein [Spongiibacteraceae bacterium]